MTYKPSEIVIVGGGPVGLWTALQIKKRMSSAKVTVYERFPEYQRHHVLKLDHWSTILYAKAIGGDDEDAFCNEIFGCGTMLSKLKAAKSVFIKTSDLESALKTYCEKLGVDIRYEKISGMLDAENRHPECKHFIAADGANSQLRKEMLGKDDVTRETLRLISEVKYVVKGKTSKLNVKDMLNANMKSDFMAFEYVGRCKNEKTPISVRFFIDQETYDAIPKASFKNPLTREEMNAEKNISNFSNTVEKYLAERAKEKGDVIEEGSLVISKLPLYVYAANRFCVRVNRQDGDKLWFVTGDAALGVPYFRALNSGLILSSRLVQILASGLNKMGDPLSIQEMAYEFHRRMHIKTEFKIAKGKNMLLESFDKIRQLGSSWDEID